ncbi:MAG: hypothetical protein COB04_19005 [Gammaproteobacteria bacterium]|nr:MAG: hypothetical protein COB04_19005 [Gammaproteobacteria bacterium]
MELRIFIKKYHVEKIKPSIKRIGVFIYNQSCIPVILLKIFPNGWNNRLEEKCNKDSVTSPKKPTFLIWLITIYVTAFGLASQKYELNRDRLENKTNIWITQLGTTSKKIALERTSQLQSEEIPKIPDFWVFSSPFITIAGDNEVDENLLDLIQEVAASTIKTLQSPYRTRVQLLLSFDDPRKTNVINSMSEKELKTISSEQLAKILGVKPNDLPKLEISTAEAYGWDLSNINLSGMDLTNIHLPNVNLFGADLRGAILSGASMEGASLSHAHLQGASLDGANLKGVVLFRANLVGASFFGVDFRNADLSQANLREAVLIDADLEGADFSYADLTGKRYAEFDESDKVASRFETACQHLAGAKNWWLAYRDKDAACGKSIPKKPDDEK